MGALDSLTLRDRCARKCRVAVDPKLLEILACPVCKASVHLLPDGSGLVCRECRLIYPIEDNVPVMLVDAARQVSPSQEIP
jgi:uncharacterized protein YbaR (Trm112 family)